MKLSSALLAAGLLLATAALGGCQLEEQGAASAAPAAEAAAAPGAEAAGAAAPGAEAAGPAAVFRATLNTRNVVSLQHGRAFRRCSRLNQAGLRLRLC